MAKTAPLVLAGLKFGRNPHECAVAKIALYASSFLRSCRNPHECAVAKACVRRVNFIRFGRNPHECAVAKTGDVKFEKNRISSQPARMRCGKASTDVSFSTARMRRNPHECAVAKQHIDAALQAVYGVATRTNALWQRWVAIQIFSVVTSQPARMRCGKVMRLAKRLQPTGRNPRECAVAKSRHCCARTENSENMNYVLLF